MCKDLSEYMNVGMFNETTLVRTEVNHFANEATALAYKECDIDKYQFSATLDIKTCDRCARLDNKVFELKDKKEGVNYPPIHPNDRCTTTPYIGEEEIAGLKRRARDPKTGKTYLVDANMSYEEWSQKYAPEQYKKYYKNPYLPKIKEAENSILDKQLGFYDDLGLNFIPKKSIISNVHIIAGLGTQTAFRSADKYSQLYGGKPYEWMKKTGKIESNKYIFDIHWVEHEKCGKCGFKIKERKLK